MKKVQKTNKEIAMNHRILYEKISDDQNSVPSEINFLFELWGFVRSMPRTIQERICEECNWSTPTFHRRMQTFNSDNSRSLKALSIEEKRKVAEVVLEVLSESTLFAIDMIRDVTKFK